MQEDLILLVDFADMNLNFETYRQVYNDFECTFLEHLEIPF